MSKPKITLGVTKRTFPQHLQRFFESKAMADESASRLKTQRDSLIAFVEANGIEDDKGHSWVEAPGVGRAKRERRVSQAFDADAAETWLRKHKLWDECTETVTVIDEDAVLGKIYDGSIPEKVGEAWYTERESFAFKVEALS
jgi:hypothetical protein